MKVIGLSEVGYDRTYIVEVSHKELESAFEKGYRENLKEMKAGDTLDLSLIPDQRRRIIDAMTAMQEAYDKFVKAAPVMAELAHVLAAKGTA